MMVVCVGGITYISGFSVEQRALCRNAYIDALISLTPCVGKVTEEPSVCVAVSQPEMRFTLSCLYARRAPRLSKRYVSNSALKAWSAAGCKDRHLFSSLLWSLFPDVCGGEVGFGFFVFFLSFFSFRAGAVLLSSCFCVHERRAKRKPLVSGINISTKSVLADS